MTIRVGSPVRVTYLDHCEDGSVPKIITAYGILRDRRPKHIVIDSWVPGFRAGTNEYDTNVKRFCVVRSCITSIVPLSEA